MTDQIEAIHRAEYLVELDKKVQQELYEKLFYERNKFNWGLQDNNAADPEQADWEDIDG